MGQEKKAWNLLEEYAEKYKPEWKDSLLEHARVVQDLAIFLGRILKKRKNINLEAIRLGAILHDIGRTLARRVVEHGVVSGEIIRREGFSEEVARIAERHVGVGISAEEAAVLGLPPRDFIPETPEERIVCYADKLLFYIPEENRHRIGNKREVVERFSGELGEEKGRATVEFMDRVEEMFTEEELRTFRDYIRDYNRKLGEH